MVDEVNIQEMGCGIEIIAHVHCQSAGGIPLTLNGYPQNFIGRCWWLLVVLKLSDDECYQSDT